MSKYENHESEWREEENRIRRQREFERALAARDPYYPPELHEQDVRAQFGVEDEEDETD